jgi:hypothetical protein
MKQFEYVKVDVSEVDIKNKSGFGCTAEERLEKLGKEGWEAVGGFGTSNSIFLFKREIENDGWEQSREPHSQRCEEVNAVSWLDGNSFKI